MSSQMLIILTTVLSMVAGSLFALWMVPAWDQVAARKTRELTRRLEELGMDTGFIPQLMRLWGIVMFCVLVFFGLVLRMIPIALALAWVVYRVPRYLIEHKIARQKTQIRDQMVGASVALGNAARAGLSLGQGFETIVTETPRPLRTELERIVHDFNHGRPLAEALIETKERLKIDSFTLFASAIQVSLERGGRITEALERIGTSLQENQRLERKLEADTESGRQVVVILAAFPFVFLAGFSLLEPEGVGLLFTTGIGQCLVVALMVMVYISVYWAMKILELDI